MCLRFAPHRREGEDYSLASSLSHSYFASAIATATTPSRLPSSPPLSPTPYTHTSPSRFHNTSQALEKDGELYLHRRGRDNVQLLINQVFALEREESSTGPLANLPACEEPLPREMPVPMPKPETRWQKYAREKGINAGKKKERMVFDEQKKEWAPRWGYKVRVRRYSVGRDRGGRVGRLG